MFWCFYVAGDYMGMQFYMPDADADVWLSLHISPRLITILLIGTVFSAYLFLWTNLHYYYQALLRRTLQGIVRYASFKTAKANHSIVPCSVYQVTLYPLQPYHATTAKQNIGIKYACAVDFSESSPIK